MPRRREADTEDMLARCPHCRGAGAVLEVATGAKVPCPVCSGVGRVNQNTYVAYSAGTLNADTAGTQPAGTPATDAGGAGTGVDTGGAGSPLSQALRQ